MDSTERLQRVLDRIRLRLQDQERRKGERTLREVATLQDVEEALDHLDDIKRELRLTRHESI